MRNTTRTKIQDYKTEKASRKALANIPNFWDRIIPEKTESGYRITLTKYRQFNS